MSGTMLEVARAAHEDCERLEQQIVADLKHDVTTHKEKLYQNHRVRKCLDNIGASSAKLRRLYKDEDRSRRDEIEAIGARGGDMDAVFSTFYSRLREVRNYHRQFPALDITEGEDVSPDLKQEPDVTFTGEEALGRYLDLHELHRSFVNSKFGKHDLEYYEYVTSFRDLAAIPDAVKDSKQYGEYLHALLTYLEGFYARTQPLANVAKMTDRVRARVEAQLEEQGLPRFGAAAEGPGGAVVEDGSLQAPPLDLEALDSPQELAALGVDAVTFALKQLGLKAGGSPAQRVDRLWSTRGRPLESLPKSVFAKGAVPAALKTPKQRQDEEEHARDVVLCEARIKSLCNVLDSVIHDTIGRVERKASQTAEEREAELAEAEEDEPEVDSDADDDYVYNPLKLPLGWDGKPIPYWLYKLHGLNKEFKCELCGEATFWGRRAFEKHFTEHSHQQGLRALGVPNQFHHLFYEVVKIDDAVALWKTLQQKRVGGYDPELEEEFEDASGNVYNKKTFDDLKRQGLLT